MKTKEKKNHQNVNQTNNNVEWYSPANYVNIARFIMKGIDIDPATSERANAAIVKAAKIYTAPIHANVTGFIGVGALPYRRYEDWGGLAHKWPGRLWLNPPFGQPENACDFGKCKKKKCKDRGYHLQTDQPGIDHWVNQAIASYELGTTTAGFILCFASVNAGWFKPLKAYPRLEFSRRVNYLNPETLEPISGVTRDSVLIMLPPRDRVITATEDLYRIGQPYGEVMTPFRYPFKGKSKQ